MIAAHVNYRNNEAGLVADTFFPIENAERRLTRAVHIRLPEKGFLPEQVEELANIMGDATGNCNLFLHYGDKGAKEVTIHATSACMVNPSPQLKNSVENLFGEGSYWCTAGFGHSSHNNDTDERIKIEPKPWERKKAQMS